MYIQQIKLGIYSGVSLTAHYLFGYRGFKWFVIRPFWADLESDGYRLTIQELSDSKTSLDG